jgi:alpha-L-arabinofuranosidase
VRTATRWARAIKMLDPDAVLVSCGMNGWNDWDRVVIDGLAPLVDLHSIHIYTGSDDYWTNVLQPHQAERAIRSAAAMMEGAAYRQSLPRMPRIAYDEWNVWYRVMTVDLAERYNFDDALAVATYLNIFIRNSGWVKMANLAQMVNAIAPIVATPETAVVQPIYYPVLLHARAALDIAVDVHVEGETVQPELPADASRWPYHVADLGPFTLIDVAASVNDRQIAVTLVNRSPSPEPARIVLRDFAFNGTAAITTVTAGGAGEPRTLPDVATVHLDEGSEHLTGGTVELTLPPQSFTVIEAPITS